LYNAIATKEMQKLGNAKPIKAKIVNSSLLQSNIYNFSTFEKQVTILIS
jgi:hypothetical protein